MKKHSLSILLWLFCLSPLHSSLNNNEENSVPTKQGASSFKATLGSDAASLDKQEQNDLFLDEVIKMLEDEDIANTEEELSAGEHTSGEHTYGENETGHPHNLKEEPISRQGNEVRIPANGHCLYTTIVLGYLLPVTSDKQEFEKRLELLTGDKYLLNGNQLIRYASDISLLYSTQNFKKVIEKFMSTIQIQKGTWGGDKEIKRISTFLHINIQEYIPFPDNNKFLIKSDLITPEKRNETNNIQVRTTIEIVRDKPRSEEAMQNFDDVALQVGKYESTTESNHLRHYRLKYNCGSLAITMGQNHTHGEQKEDSTPYGFTKENIRMEVDEKKEPRSYDAKEKEDATSYNSQSYPSQNQISLVVPIKQQVNISDLSLNPKKPRKKNNNFKLYFKQLHGLMPESQQECSVTVCNKSFSSSLIEQLAKGFERTLNMPDIIEKHLDHLSYFIDLLEYAEKGIQETILLSNGTEITAENVEKELFMQAWQKANEQLPTKSKGKNLNALKKVKKMVLQEKKWEEARKKVKKVCERIYDFNFRKTIKLVKQAKANIPTVQEGSLLLLIGGTGQGKSTTLHFLAGSVMEITESKGLTNIAPKKDGIPDAYRTQLKNVICSPFALSQTKEVTTVALNFAKEGLDKKILKKLKELQKRNIILCDTPGFGDTEGAEQDIANSLGIIKVLQRCKKVKPIVVISYHVLEAQRMDGIKKLTETLSHFIKFDSVKTEGNTIASFSYLFTKVPKNKVKQIERKLQDLYNKKEYDSDSDNDDEQSFSLALLEEKFLKSMKDQKPIIIDPIEGDRIDILQKLGNSSFINNPKETFQSYIPQQSMNKVEMQMIKHKDRIREQAAIGNYRIASYKLTELQQFARLYGKDIKQTYQEAQKKVYNIWENRYQTITNVFVTKLNQDEVLGAETLQNFKTLYTITTQGKLFQEHLVNAPQKQDLHNILKQQLALLRCKIDDATIDEENLLLYLENLDKITQLFPSSLENFQEDVFKKIEERIEENYKDALLQLYKNQYTALKSSITQLKGSQKLKKILHDRIKSSQYHDELVQKIKEKFNTIIEKNIQILPKTGTTSINEPGNGHNNRLQLITSEQIKNLNKTVQQLQEASKIFDFMEGIEKKLGPIVQYVKGLGQAVDDLLSKEKMKVIYTAEECLAQIEEIRTLQIIYKETTPVFVKAQVIISEKKKNTIQELEFMLSRLFDMNQVFTNDDYQTFLSHITTLQRITRTPEKELKVLYQKLKEIKNNIDNIDQIENERFLSQTTAILLQFKRIQKLKERLPAFIQEAEQTLRKYIEKTLQKFLETYHVYSTEDMSKRIETLQKVKNSMQSMKDATMAIKLLGRKNSIDDEGRNYNNNSIIQYESKIDFLKKAKKSFEESGGFFSNGGLYSRKDKSILEQVGCNSIKKLNNKITLLEEEVAKLKSKNSNLESDHKEATENINSLKEIRKKNEAFRKSVYKSIETMGYTRTTMEEWQKDISQLTLEIKKRQAQWEECKKRNYVYCTTPPFDKHKIAQYKKYLDACDEFLPEPPLLTQKNRNILNDYLAAYVANIKCVTKHHFSTLIKIIKDGAALNRKQKVDVLQQHGNALDNMLTLEEETLSECSKNYKKNVMNLHEEVIKAQKKFSITMSIKNAQFLKPLDPWTTNQKGFSQLHEKYQEIKIKKMEHGNEIAEKIKNEAYKEAHEHLCAFRKETENDVVLKKIFDELKESLNTKLISTFEDTCTCMKRNPQDIDFKSLKRNFKSIEKAKKLFYDSNIINNDELLNQNQKKELYERYTKLQKPFDHFLQQQRNQNNSLIFDKEFVSFEKNIKKIKMLEDCEITSKLLEGSQVISNLSNLTSSRDDRLKSIVDSYNTNPLVNPLKDIHKQLLEASEYDKCYEKTLNLIEKNISVTFNKLADSAPEEENKINRNRKINDCKRILDSLPSIDLKEKLSEKLTQCQEKVKELEEKKKKEMEVVAASSPPQEKLAHYHKLLKEKEDALAGSMKTRIIEDINNHMLELFNNSKENNITKALKNLKVLYTYNKVNVYEESKHSISEIGENFRLCKTELHKKFKQATTVDLVLDKEYNEDSMQDIHASLHLLNQFVTYSQDPNFIKALLPDNYQEEIEKQKKNITAFFKDCTENRKKSIQDQNFPLLKKTFKNMKEAHEAGVLTLAKKENIGKKELSGISYKVMQEKIQEAKQHMIIEIEDEGIFNEKTLKFSQKRKNIYQALRKKIEFINSIEKLGTQHVENKESKPKIIENLIKKVSETIKTLTKEKTKEDFSDKEIIDFRTYKECLQSASQYLDSCQLQLKMRNINMYLKHIADDVLVKKIRNSEGDLHYAVEKIITLKKLEMHSGDLQFELNTKIDVALAGYEYTNIAKLAYMLKGAKRDAGIARRIISEHTTFKGMSNAIFHDKTSKMKIDDLLKRVKVRSSDTEESDTEESDTEESDTEESDTEESDTEESDTEESDAQKKELSDTKQKKLKNTYEKFYKRYQFLTEKYLKKQYSNACADLIDETIKKAKQCASFLQDHFINNTEEKEEMKEKEPLQDWQVKREIIPDLVANISCVWTHQNAEHYFKANTKDIIEEERRAYLMQPHAVQIIAIFQLLGIHDKAKQVMPNHFIQIPTGEGKSVTLAFTAIVLTLLGFDVRCACYSQDLSQRDSESFTRLFEAFQVRRNIQYGTFKEVCSQLINEEGSIADQILDLCLNPNKNPKRSRKLKHKRPKILLVDELDVFFSPDFYGKLYRPVALLKDDIIKSLIQKIWETKDDVTFEKIKSENAYKKCRIKFSHMGKIIDEEVKKVIRNVQIDYKNMHLYKIQAGKIQYFENSNLTDKINYGYETLFCYFFEHEQYNISDEALDKQIGFYIQCGNFSYAELPREFKRIMGVTATLEELTEKRMETITNTYEIKKHTYLPSIYYRDTELTKKPNSLRVVSNDNYFETINQEIGRYLNRDAEDRDVKPTERRAVLVFFENEAILENFAEYCAFEKCRTIKASLDLNEKNRAIRNAAVSGNVILMGRSFGRGSDFVCYDPRIHKNGGVHVLQTFLSLDIVEETQIQGRTYRQGEPGSYSMVLNEDHLQRDFGISPDDDNLSKNSNEIYEFLSTKRKGIFNEQLTSIKSRITFARENHEASQVLRNALHQGNTEEVMSSLLQLQYKACCRTIILMDATGSMRNVLQAAKDTVHDTFERITKIMKEHDKSPDCFTIQFVAYRNYNYPESLLEHSGWVSSPDCLKNFMDKVTTQGGMGNEAMEMGLAYAYQMHKKAPLSQIILIGDMPANTKKEVDTRRKIKTEAFWKNKGGIYAEATHYEEEVNKFKNDGVPIHAFYVEGSFFVRIGSFFTLNNTKTAFKKIAKDTNGKYEELDMRDIIPIEQRSKQMVDLLSKEVLQSVGGEEFVQAYQQAYI